MIYLMHKKNFFNSEIMKKKSIYVFMNLYDVNNMSKREI